MGKSFDPAKMARQIGDAVYSRVLVDPADYIGFVDDAIIQNKIIIYVDGFDPFRPLNVQGSAFFGLLEEGAGAVAANEHAKAEVDARVLKVVNVQATMALWMEIRSQLEDGKQVTAIQRHIHSRQLWPCFAIVQSRAELIRELRVRLEIGKCDVDYSGWRLSGGVILLCRMLPRAW